ncbi:MAG: hypothetical protein ABI679_04550 [Gemmatimonadota bacterium]
MGKHSRFTVVGLVTLAALACSSGSDNNKPPVISAFEGVLGGNDGAEAGTVSVNVSDDGTGTGSFKVGAVVTTLQNVSTANGHLTATGNGFAFDGTINGAVIDGSYTSAAGGGFIAALGKGAGEALAKFCASFNGTDDLGGAAAGTYAFVYNTSTNAIRGGWTAGAGNAFHGVVSGFSGNDQAVMSGHPGNVTIVPDVPNGSMGGVYDLDSGAQGTMSGPTCP